MVEHPPVTVAGSDTIDWRVTQANRCLAAALSLAAAGYALTPVTITRLDSGKKSARFHRGWRHEDAWSCDPDQVKAWWTDHPQTSFALGAAANGIEGVDLDVKDGVDAVAWWDAQGLPGSPFTQTTPSGGLHLIWRCGEGGGLPQEAGKTFGRGIDTRNRSGLFFATGAYVVGERGQYGYLGALPALDELATTPQVVLDLFELHGRKEREARPVDGRIVVHDETWQRQVVSAALQRIREHDRSAGGYRDLLNGAGMLYGRAVEQGFLTAERAVAAILDAHRSVWGDQVWPENVHTIRVALADGPRTERWRVPREPVRDTEHETGPNAGNDATQSEPWAGEGGYDATEAAARAFDDSVQAELRKRAVRRAADDAEHPARPSMDSLAVWDDELESVPLPRMAVEQLIPEWGVGWLGGPSGTYKSFVAVQLARALAHGVPAMGHSEFTVEQARRVLYVAGEDSAGVAMRSRAARHRLGIAAGRELVMYPRPIDLTSEREVSDLVAFAVRHGIEFVIVDTFRQSTLGVNENDNSEVGVILGRLIAMRDEHEIGSLLVDHTNKTAQGLADLGGAGAKRANADYVLMIDLPNSSRDRDQQRTLRVAKLKNLPDGRTWPIKLETVSAVTDAKGRPSAVAVVGEVLPDEEAWIAAGLAWTDKRWLLPADVEALIGHGADAARDLARYMRVQAADSRGTGESRLEAVRAVQASSGRGGVGHYGKDDRTLRRGWSRLVEIDRLSSVTSDPTSKSMWVGQVADPHAPLSSVEAADRPA